MEEKYKCTYYKCRRDGGIKVLKTVISTKIVHPNNANKPQRPQNDAGESPRGVSIPASPKNATNTGPSSDKPTLGEKTPGKRHQVDYIAANRFATHQTGGVKQDLGASRNLGETRKHDLAQGRRGSLESEQPTPNVQYVSKKPQDNHQKSNNKTRSTGLPLPKQPRSSLQSEDRNTAPPENLTTATRNQGRSTKEHLPASFGKPLDGSTIEELKSTVKLKFEKEVRSLSNYKDSTNVPESRRSSDPHQGKQFPTINTKPPPTADEKTKEISESRRSTDSPGPANILRNTNIKSTKEDTWAKRKEHTPANSKEDNPAKTKEDTPAKVKEDTPAKVKEDTPAKVKEDTPAKVKEDTPANVKEDTPAKVKEDTPAKVKEDTPAKVKEDTSAKRTENTSAKRTENTLANRIESTSAKRKEDTPAKRKEDTPAKTKVGNPAKTKEDTLAKTKDDTPAKTKHDTPTSKNEGTASKAKEYTPAKTKDTWTKTKEENQMKSAFTPGTAKSEQNVDLKPTKAGISSNVKDEAGLQSTAEATISSRPLPERKPPQVNIQAKTKPSPPTFPTKTTNVPSGRIEAEFMRLKTNHIPLVSLFGLTHPSISQQKLSLLEKISKNFDFVLVNIDKVIGEWKNRSKSIPLSIPELARELGHSLLHKASAYTVDKTLTEVELCRIMKYAIVAYHNENGRSEHAGFILENFPVSPKETSLLEEIIYPIAIGIYMFPTTGDNAVTLPVNFRRTTIYDEKVCRKVAYLHDTRLLEIIHPAALNDTKITVHLLPVIQEMLENYWADVKQNRLQPVVLGRDLASISPTESLASATTEIPMKSVKET